MFSSFQAGGFFMYVILAVSIVALAIFFERAAHLFGRLRIDADAVMRKILLCLDEANYLDALKECGRVESHPLGRILKAGLLKADKRDKEIERAIEQKIMYEIPMIKKRINYLAMLANVSTLLGLLGTIVGLIKAFQGVSNVDAAMKQEILAQGISMAMLTTAFGLIVAIPCIVGYYLLNNRGDHIIDQFEEKGLNLFNELSSLKRKDKDNNAVRIGS